MAVLKKYKINGIIAPLRDKQVDAIANLGIPTVNISATKHPEPFPTVTFDNFSVGEVAAETLRKTGFTNYYYLCRYKPYYYGQQRYKGFKTHLQLHQLNCSIMAVPAAKIENEINGARLATSSIGKIIDKLKFPAAIYTENDILGYALLRECKGRGIKIPYDLAVLGTDNDSIFCKLSSPELSSVKTNAELVGFKAASILDRLLQGQKVEKETLIGGAEAVTRNSTFISSTNSIVETALDFIRKNANMAISVDDVAEALPMSRRNLEIQFKRNTGTTIHTFINNARINNAAKMLRETMWPLKKIVEEAGFGSLNSFIKLFKEHYGITPGRYRSACKK